MPDEIKSEDRTSLNVSKEKHQRFSNIAGLLGISLKDACDQAIEEWSNRNGKLAHKKAAELVRQQ